MNHSCDPSVIFNTDERVVVAVVDLKEGKIPPNRLALYFTVPAHN